MTSMTPDSAPLNDAELDRLQTLLAADAVREVAMPLDALQGFLCAVASAPEMIPPSRWLPFALGGELRWESEDERREFLDLVMRLNNDVARELLEGRGVDPIVYPESPGGEDYDYELWAMGYLDGVDLADPPWDEASRQEKIDELLFPFMILAGGLDEDPELRESLGLKPDEEEELVASCRDSLPDAIQAAYDYWRKRGGASTVGR